MGCGISVHVEFDPINPSEEVMLEEFYNMGFSKANIDTMYTFFVSMDADQSHEISLHEFLRAMGVEATPFMKSVFGVMDMDGSGELNFLELMCSLWNFLCNDERTLGSFIYLTVPKNESNERTGRVAFQQVADVIRGIHYSKTDANEKAIDDALTKFKRSYHADISAEELEMYIYENQSILTPILNAQLKMRQISLGVEEWHRLLKYRRKSRELVDFKYPLVLRNKVEKQLILAIEANKRKKQINSHNSHSVGRRGSVLLSFFGLNVQQNITKKENDLKRTPKITSTKKSGNAEKFDSKRAEYLDSQKVNKQLYKNYDDKKSNSKSRPQSASAKTYRGAPISATSSAHNFINGKKKSQEV